MTVQNALRELREEGLIVSRQGSGVFVRERTERPVGLRPHIERAFEAEHVTIDFAGFSGETLHGVIQEPLDKIRIGLIKPATVTIRLLLPDTSRPMVLPCRADDLTDDPDYRTRMHRLTFRHAHAILDTVQELASLGLIQDADVQIRAHGCPPLFKLYILNDEDVFFGFYPITRHTIPFAELTDEPFIALPTAAGPLRQFWLAIEHRNGEPRVAAEVETAEETFEAVASGLGLPPGLI